MTIDQSSSGDRREDTKTERDHPQTRKAEPDARGLSKWREDVVPPEGERKEGAERAPHREREQESLGGSVGELAEEAEAVRRQAVGAETVGNALGSSAGRDVGSGTEPDRGELGGGERMAEDGTSIPGGTRSPGGEGRD